MKIQLTKFLNSLSMALDYVESEIVKTTRNHVKRVGILTNKMAVCAGMDQETVYSLTQAAVLHDCALSEYLRDELNESGAYVLEELNMQSHCRAGEDLLMKIPMYKLVPGAVLYHHERADGTGAFRLTAAETPLSGQIVHMADIVDVTFSLDTMDEQKYKNILTWIDGERGKSISDECADLFLKSVDYKLLLNMSGEGCRSILRTMLPEFVDEISTEVLREMATFFAQITDYKSHFTWRHSIGIAEKAEAFGNYSNYDAEVCDKLYIAGALHDIGKLLISNDILEKPGKLTNDEYKEIQNHAMGTWNLLKDIEGMEDITRWAALHHEKIDGSGYPFGLTGSELGPNERLMACLDIYQALVEERPYKAGFSHEEAMDILNKMGNAGQLDKQILEKIDECFASAPQLISTQIKKEKNLVISGESWKCPVCGYVYEGSLPKDFICPRCEQPGVIFEKIH